MASSVDGLIRVVVEQNKIEDEVVRLNTLGYTVMKSEKTSDGKVMLFAQKIFTGISKHGN